MCTSQFILTVTEASSSSDISEVYRKGLKRQPDPMIVCVDQNSDKLGGQLVSYQAVKEYLSLLWGKYQAGNRKKKGEILDQLVENLGIHRKAAIRLMNSKSEPRTRQGQVCWR